MRGYRCFLLNRAGRIEAAEVVEAKTDDDALAAALRLIEQQSHYATVEVWEGARKVFPQSRDRADLETVKRALQGVGLLVYEDGPPALH